MEFKEFESKLGDDVQSFLTNWIENSRDTPDEFPMKMDEDEWWEQFIAYQLG